MRKQILVFLCDEHIKARLMELIRGSYDNLVIRVADSVSDAYQVILEHRIDTFICGIVEGKEKHGKMSVYRFIASVRMIAQYYFTPVILISNVEDPSNYCFRELHCFDVLEYPFYADRFLYSLNRALCFTSDRREESMLYIQEQNVLYPIRCSQICYIQSTNHVMELVLKNGSRQKIRYYTMQQILDAADVSYLIQCARNVIINTDYIKSVDYTNRLVTMQNQEQLPVGPAYVKTLQKYFGKKQTR